MRQLIRVSRSLRFHAQPLDRRLNIKIVTTKRAFTTTTTNKTTMPKQKKASHQAASPPATPAQSNTSPPVPLTTAPKDNQNVEHESALYTTIREGRAYILIPPNAPRLLDPKTHKDEPAQSVFYNPIQQYNRDLSVLAIRAWGEDWLVRNEGKAGRRREKRRRGGKVGEGVEGGDVNANREVEQSAVRKRKRDDEGVEADLKRQKVGTSTVQAGDFEDGGVEDDDLLAVESSMHQQQDENENDNDNENAPFSTAREPASTNGHESINTGQDTTPIPPPSKPQEPTKEDEKEKDQDTRPPIRILDALSATGLRALRYATELPFPTQITANDLSPKAASAIKLNIQHNRLEHRIKTTTGNANAHMYSFVGQEGTGGPGHKYHVIDLDPYGTAVPFLDAAVQATADGGLLCVTCTDTGVFNSMGYAEKCFSLYGGLPGKGEHCHEIGLRLILHAIAIAAGKYGIAIEPLLSLSIDYYARVFVRVRKSPADVKFLASKTMLVYACDHGCGAWFPQFMMRTQEMAGKKGTTFYKHIVSQGPSCERYCECCGGKMHVAGPMWGGALHNPSFVQRVLDLVPVVEKEGEAEGEGKEVYKTRRRVEGMLSVAREEMMVHELNRLLVPEPEGKPDSQQQAKRNGATKEGAEKTNEDAEPETTAAASKAPKKPERTRRNSSSPPSSPIPTQTADLSIPSNPNPNPAPTTTTPNPNPTYHPLSPSFRDNHPFYLIPSALARTLHIQSPPDAAIRGALRSLGHQAVRSHAQPGTIKTDAPWSAIWEIMVAWRSRVGGKEGGLREGMGGWEVVRRVEGRRKEREALEDAEKEKERESGDGGEGGGGEKESGEVKEKGKREIVFDEKLGRDEEAGGGRRLVRYQINPRANWGPMARAK